MALVPFDLNGGGSGRALDRLGRMLGIYSAQQRFAQADEGMDDLVYYG